MDKRVIGSERYSVETRVNPVYDGNEKYSDISSNRKTQSAYFEFQAKDQTYSYALDPDWQCNHGNVSDGSNGTISSYAEGRVGTAENNITLNNPFYSQNTQQVQVTGPYVSGNGLSESMQSNGTTYDQIKENDIMVQVTAGVNQQNNAKARSCAFGRLILITTIVMVLIAAGVLVYIFVIKRKEDSQFPTCDPLPQVLNGQVSESKYDEGHVTITILCKQGYDLHGNGTMECMEGEWSEKPRCEPIECGPYPKVANGEVNGTDNLFGSTASITCIPGFLPVESKQIQCLEDGNWTASSGCDEHPCGLYEPPHDTMVVDEMTLSKMMLCLKCKPGLRFVDGLDLCVTCENGEWTGSPECEIPGNIYFDPSQTIYNVDERVSLRCIIQGSPEWQSVVIARADFQGSNTEPLFHIKNTSDEILTRQLSDTDTFYASYELTTDGVAVEFVIDHAQCEDTGFYICGNVAGAIDSPDEVKSANVSVNIIDTTSSVPEVNVPDTMYVDIEGNISCTGELGKDKNGTIVGEIVLQIKYKNTDSFQNLSFVTEDSRSQNYSCRINETIVSTVIPESDINEASVRCVVLSTDGIQLASAVESLNIVFPIVNISNLPPVFTFGETATLKIIMVNIVGWDFMEVRRRCSGTDEDIAQIGARDQDNPLLIGDHIRLTEKDVMPDSARVVLEFEYVQCSDSCGTVGESVEYSAAVRINNDKWIENSSMIMFQRQPDVPLLQVPYNSIDGNSAIFECMGQIGAPKGYLEIESTFEGTNFTVFLSSMEGKDSNAVGSINSVTDESGECSNMRSISFQIKNMTSKFHQESLRCVSRPSALLLNGKPAVSNVKAIEVIPENYCSKPEGYTGARRHPFHCNMFVSCHNGQVTGVPSGCREDECFQDTTCYLCEAIGGCSITDIYVDNFSDWVQLGDSATLMCKVKDFQGLTNIVIHKGSNNTVVSSFLDGEFEAGVTRVQDGSYITGNNGQLMLYIASVQCKDEGTYRCVPGGTGKYSEDETNLVVGDAGLNTVC